MTLDISQTKKTSNSFTTTVSKNNKRPNFMNVLKFKEVQMINV